MSSRRGLYRVGQVLYQTLGKYCIVSYRVGQVRKEVLRGGKSGSDLGPHPPCLQLYVYCLYYFLVPTPCVELYVYCYYLYITWLLAVFNCDTIALHCIFLGRPCGELY